MTNEQLIEKFNPANLKNLTAEDLETMHGLTNDQLDVLANAYPNQPNRKAYIRLYDKNVPANKQLYNLSTWQNLRNLRKYNAKSNLIAWDFFSPSAPAAPVKNTGAIPGAKNPKKVTVDMTAKEAAAELAAKTTTAPVVDINAGNSGNSENSGDDTNKEKATTTTTAVPPPVVKQRVTKPAGKGKGAAKADKPAAENAGNSENSGDGKDGKTGTADTEFTDGQGDGDGDGVKD